jgi:uncharacterized protein (TIGR02996 family)
MSSHDAFLRAVIESPDDDRPRLVYADWLDERGDPRGEFIRLQCELEAKSCSGVPFFKLRTRSRELLAQHGREWIKPFRGLARWYRFRRGFVETVYVSPDRYREATAELPKRTPIRSIRLYLTDVTIPRDVVEFVPESVARENVLMPVSVEGRLMRMAAAECSGPSAELLIERLRFILNREIELLPARREDIIDAIGRHYGQSEIESFVSCTLQIALEDALRDESLAAEFRTFSRIVLEGIRRSARGVRFDPEGIGLRVSYHLDGRWVRDELLAADLMGPLLSLIREFADIPAAEALPQRGELSRSTYNGYVRLNVEIIEPNRFGPSIILMSPTAVMTDIIPARPGPAAGRSAPAGSPAPRP